MSLRRLLPPALALGLAGALLLPGEEAEGYQLQPFTLPFNQRDFRVFNNFLDAGANNNTTPHPDYPGAQGAVMAIWKGAVEWGSEPHGTGGGDTHQGNVIGSGGANFDFTYQGLAAATQAGSPHNVVHADPANGGNTYAVTTSWWSGGNGSGWSMKFFENWGWVDGPGGSNNADIQGVATHEFGHCLGLGHTSSSGATMQAGVQQHLTDNARSIATDDINGVRAAYGVKDPGKARIDSVSILDGVVTITGVNFHASDNDVWFTRATPLTQNGTPVKVFGAPSPDTQTITVDLPTNVAAGDVLVKRDGSDAGALSNAWPFDPGADPGPPAGSLTLTNVSPTSILAVEVDGAPDVVLTGTGLDDVTEVRVDGVALPNGFPPSWIVNGPTQITIAHWPQVSQLGLVDIEVVTPTDSTTIEMDVLVNEPPVLDVLNSVEEGGFLFSSAGVTLRCGSEPGDVYFVVVSWNDGATSLPGIVDLLIGNNDLLSLIGVWAPLIPASGWTQQTFPIGSPQTGTNWFWQGAVYDIEVLSFPLVPTNKQETIVLF